MAAPASQMAADVQARIRALPGNQVCVDCNNLKPQWASVSYGTMMCLECSGHHRSLGVHLSFVRSVQMDSWKEREIRAMESSGGNAACVEFFKSKGIDKDMRIPQKYNTKQAAYYKERLSRRLDGKTEPPPDPGRYDPSTGGSEALGAEALPGETTDQYNARQAVLREEARERLRAKFGGGGGMGSMGGIGSDGNSGGGGGRSSDSLGEGLGGVLGGAAGAVGSIAGGGWNFLREKVIENDNLRDKVGGAVGGLAQLTGNVLGGVRQSVQDGDFLESLKRNATLQEGSVASRGLEWGTGAASTVWEKSPGIADFFNDEGGGGSSAPQAPRCARGHALRAEPRGDLRCTLCAASGTRYACSAGCNYDICTKCFEKPGIEAAKAARQQDSGGGSAGAKGGKKDSFDFDDDWGDDAPAPKDPTADDMARLAKEMGMKLESPDKRAAPKQAASPSAGGYPSSPARPAPAPVAEEVKEIMQVKNMELSAPKKEEAKKKAALTSPDDFFSDFGM